MGVITVNSTFIKQDVLMKTVGMVLATLALLGTSLSPLAAEAQSAFAAPPGDKSQAVCTAWEPIEQRSGVSFYAGNVACTVLASDPTVLKPYMPVALNPDFSKVTLVCLFPVGNTGELGAAWSAHNYEFLAASFCYGMRRAGVAVNFIDPDYT
jgi:hypothetical protein